MVKTNSKSGFTMVEIISVLVIIGIMAAVAAPKFINMAGEARYKSAFAGISEAKGTLSVAFAKAYLDNDGAVVAPADVLSAASITSATDVDFGDVTITVTAGTGEIELAVVDVDGKTDFGTNSVPSDAWTVPTQL